MQRIIQLWKSGRAGKLVVGCGGLLGLLFICSICSVIFRVGAPTEEVAEAPARTPAVVKAEATATPERAGAVSLGEEVRTERWLVTISEVKRAEWLPWNNRKLEPDGQWVIVYGEARNLTTEQVTIHSRDFVLTTPSLKGEIDVHRDATGAAGLESGVERTVAGFGGLAIKAGQSAPLVIAFDVPDVVEQATLQVVDAEIGINLGSVKQVAMLPTPVPTKTLMPTDTPFPTDTPKPTDTVVPTDTPRPTDTVMPTDTPIPTVAPTPTTVSQLSGPAPRIVAVDKVAEFVTIRNQGDEPVNLHGWTLVSERGNQAWTVPSDFILQPGATVRIHSGTGQNDESNLYSGFDGNIWRNDKPDPAVLLDPSGVEVSRFP